jgi:hypothetical protein
MWRTGFLSKYSLVKKSYVSRDCKSGNKSYRYLGKGASKKKEPKIKRLQILECARCGPRGGRVSVWPEQRD